MNAYVNEVGFDISGFPDLPGSVPEHFTRTPWGYIVDGGGSQPHAGNTQLRSLLLRAAGVFLLIAGIGLVLLPTNVPDADLLAMKLGAMALFAVIGVTLIWAGRQKPGVVMQVHTQRGEVRLGTHDVRGEFRLLDCLRFREVTSVYVMRPERPNQNARLYLRIGPEGSIAIEIARGRREDMENLRQRLMVDLTYRY